MIKILSLIGLVICVATAMANADDAFFSRWRDSGSFGSDIGCVVRSATNLDKISLSDVETGRILRAGDVVEVSAARNEYEGFQLVLTPLPDAAKNVRVTCTTP